MKTFLVGLALGFGMGFLLLPRSGNERDDLMRERTRELQRNLPQDQERTLQRAAIPGGHRFLPPRQAKYLSHAAARRVGIHPVGFLNLAKEKELVSAGIDPELAAKIVAGRPYVSLQDAMDRGLLSLGTLAVIQRAAEAREPLSLQPLA